MKPHQFTAFKYLGIALLTGFLAIFLYGDDLTQLFSRTGNPDIKDLSERIAEIQVYAEKLNEPEVAEVFRIMKTSMYLPNEVWQREICMEFPQAIDPQILELAWKRGTIAGIYMVRRNLLHDDQRSAEEWEIELWPSDSLMIQNCIHNGH